MQSFFLKLKTILFQDRCLHLWAFCLSCLLYLLRKLRGLFACPIPCSWDLSWYSSLALVFASILLQFQARSVLFIYFFLEVLPIYIMSMMLLHCTCFHFLVQGLQLVIFLLCSNKAWSATHFVGCFATHI